MPLIQGYSRKAIGKNTATELKEGRSRSQAIAIALSTARRAKAAHYCPKCKRQASGAESARCRKCFGKLRKIG